MCIVYNLLKSMRGGGRERLYNIIVYIRKASTYNGYWYVISSLIMNYYLYEENHQKITVALK